MWLLFNTDIEIQSPPENSIGFVYLITNLTNGKKYIGKKLFYKFKNSKPTNIESDWKTYTGSSKSLLIDIQEGHPIKKEILAISSRKSNLSYLEAFAQIHLNALLNPEYYNGIINLRINHRTLSPTITNELAELSSTLYTIEKQKYF